MTEANRVYHVLPEPETTAKAAQAVEVIRAWIIDQQLTLTLSPTVFDNPAVWGTLLADTTYHIANAMQQVNKASDIPGTMKEIQRAFNEKMNQPLEDRPDIDVAQPPPPGII